MNNHYFARSPQNILSLREDTLSQLLTLSNVRPGGRYLVVDDTGGLVTAALLERMGSDGRVMSFVESDSPPAWGVLNVMNFSERETGCVKWLNWMESSEGYERREFWLLSKEERS
jgi:tRNA (adenine-N(1)-)-methyltransferase non-catalytic subunit